MAKSQVVAPSPLPPPLLATSASPSSHNRQPSMVPHRRLRPANSPPSGPYKRAPRPRLTPPQPPSPPCALGHRHLSPSLGCLTAARPPVSGPSGPPCSTPPPLPLGRQPRASERPYVGLRCTPSADNGRRTIMDQGSGGPRPVDCVHGLFNSKISQKINYPKNFAK
jgi:hypothetical protein